MEMPICSGTVEPKSYSARMPAAHSEGAELLQRGRSCCVAQLFPYRAFPWGRQDQMSLPAGNPQAFAVHVGHLLRHKLKS